MARHVEPIRCLDARAALDNYRHVGPGAATDAQETQALIRDLEQKIDQGIPDK